MFSSCWFSPSYVGLLNWPPRCASARAGTERDPARGAGVRSPAPARRCRETGGGWVGVQPETTRWQGRLVSSGESLWERAVYRSPEPSVTDGFIASWGSAQGVPLTLRSLSTQARRGAGRRGKDATGKDGTLAGFGPGESGKEPGRRGGPAASVLSPY